MAVLSLEREWRILISGIEHRIDLKLDNRGLFVSYEVKVDGAAQIAEKNTDLTKMWGEYPLEVAGAPFTLRLFKKGILGMATESELFFGEELILPGEPYELLAESQTVSESSPSEQTEGKAHMYPKLPAACPACGVPIHMQNVKWVGPMSAACPSCGSTIEIEWREM